MKDEYEIYLRPLREEDAKTSWRWRNDPRVHAILHQIARDELGLSEIRTTIRVANIGSLKAALKSGSIETSRDDTFVYLTRKL